MRLWLYILIALVSIAASVTLAEIHYASQLPPMVN